MNFQKILFFFAFLMPKWLNLDISTKSHYFHTKIIIFNEKSIKKVMHELASSFLIRSFLIRLVSNSLVSNSTPGDELEMSAL